MPWLRDEAAREFERLADRRSTDVPLRFDAALRDNGRIDATSAPLVRRCVAESAGARLSMPLRDDRFIAALASAGRR